MIQSQIPNTVSLSLTKLQEIVEYLSVASLFLKRERESFKAGLGDNYPVFDPSRFWHGFPETLTVKS